MRDENYHRKDWMSDDQWECSLMLADLFGGFHHVLGDIKQCYSGIVVNVRNGNWTATYDFDGLTRAVIMAHDRMIRFEILPSGPGMIKLRLFKRHTRVGDMIERHPTIEEAIATLRKGDRNARR